jgi:DNA primase
MVRAASLAGARKLELRVVPLPAGRDPADLVAIEGAESLRERVRRAAPFVSFQVQRTLERADVRSVEGRDQAVRELRPLFATMAPGLLRDELGRRVADTLRLGQEQLGDLFAARDRPASGFKTGVRAPVDFSRTLDPAVRGERAFLALCVALPSAGERELEQTDLSEHITSTRLRRAAEHLRGRLETPLSGLPPDDEELARTVADLVERAGRAGTIRPERIEQQRLYLELARLERAIRRARLGPVAAGVSLAAGSERGAEVQALAREREAVRATIHEIDVRLERPV